jgi:hypothetical protein
MSGKAASSSPSKSRLVAAKDDDGDRCCSVVVLNSDDGKAVPDAVVGVAGVGSAVFFVFLLLAVAAAVTKRVTKRHCSLGTCAKTATWVVLVRVDAQQPTRRTTHEHTRTQG